MVYQEVTHPYSKKLFFAKVHTFSPELFSEKLQELQGCFQTKWEVLYGMAAQTNMEQKIWNQWFFVIQYHMKYLLYLLNK